MSDELLHYGIKRRSGRYPWGSGTDPQRSQDILSVIDEYRAEGLTEKQIADRLDLTTTQLRSEIAWANKARKQTIMDSVVSMKERGLSNTEIGSTIGISEGSVRNYLLNQDSTALKQLDNITEQLKNGIDNNSYLDIGAGSEIQMGISKHKMKAAVKALQDQGYHIHEIYVKRLDDPSKWTTVKVLSKEADVNVVKQNQNLIRPPEGWTDDNGLTFQNMGPVTPVNADRVQVVWGPDGGSDKDGVIELRRGAQDLDLGESKYAQVRIQVGDGHYLKGMAMYSDNMPSGSDIRFYTNKNSEVGKIGAMKALKDNPDNRFGATITRQKGALNIVNQEGDWSDWDGSKFSAQFLSKQPLALVRDRLSKTFAAINNEMREINSLTNPIVKKHLLNAYADDVASKMKHLKVQGLPRTKAHVILPFPEMNANEVYAPNYKNGEKLVLVRYPHGGTFEIPELTVNNRGPAKSILGNNIDSIGIHPSVAHKLSGADFDGDTVYAIPNNNKQIKSTRSLKELERFDPIQYKITDSNVKPMSTRYQQIQMGVVSNLITDMTIKGAANSEIARAVKHSMVVIDAVKHDLDYRKSRTDNGIQALQKKYQTYVSSVDNKQHTGASTIISRSKQEVLVGGTKVTTVNPDTGRKRTSVVGGEKRDIMDIVPTARDLSSGTTVENLYADYADRLRKVSQDSAKTAAQIKPAVRSKEAAKTYAPEVDSLRSKLNTALSNAPKERQAQILASQTYYKNMTPDMSPDEKKKLKSQSLAGARNKVGSKKTLVNITDKEWDAIQKGAVSNNMLEQILNNSDMDRVRELATPRNSVGVSPAKLSRARAMLNGGATYAEVADAVGVSVSALRDNLN